MADTSLRSSTALALALTLGMAPLSLSAQESDLPPCGEDVPFPCLDAEGNVTEAPAGDDAAAADEAGDPPAAPADDAGDTPPAEDADAPPAGSAETDAPDPEPEAAEPEPQPEADTPEPQPEAPEAGPADPGPEAEAPDPEPEAADLAEHEPDADAPEPPAEPAPEAEEPPAPEPAEPPAGLAAPDDAPEADLPDPSAPDEAPADGTGEGAETSADAPAEDPAPEAADPVADGEVTPPDMPDPEAAPEMTEDPAPDIPAPDDATDAPAADDAPERPASGDTAEPAAPDDTTELPGETAEPPAPDDTTEPPGDTAEPAAPDVPAPGDTPEPPAPDEPVEAPAPDGPPAAEAPAAAPPAAPRAADRPTPPPAAAREDAEPVEVGTEEVTEADTRDSTEDFPNLVAGESAGTGAAADGGDRSGLSAFERAVILGLGAVAVGSILSSGEEVVANTGDRLVVREGDELYVLKNDDVILRQPGSEIRTQTYEDGSTRTVITRPDGVEVVTLRAADGTVLRRVRILPDGTRTVIFDDTAQVPPVDVSALPAPPAGEARRLTATDTEALRRALATRTTPGIDRAFSLRQIRQIYEVRVLAPEIELDAINFRTGSAAIPPSEAEDLSLIGRIIAAIIDEDPDSVFLVEGHTDAVGDAAYNLALSDRRAESVALALTEYFDVPPENLITQGYGESRLRIETEAAEPANRRAVVRNITPLLR
ncbi:OmpA family protein [Histidinibacterium lentulum]|uniref:OmpA family protein n=1 Tax=Histidinibacterium lentulum TaxID=2480588 RepID=A0A3N2R855_9RHOB|nr:OmpA family protein [Histidinibacterium lentulum]ROU03593.1 OmpA family protein [Histidinibacterium lentulum]